jgi:hypothetical protein
MRGGAESPTDRRREVITHGTMTIGVVEGSRDEGFRAFDDDGRLLETFETLPAARRSVYEHHRGREAA